VAALDGERGVLIGGFGVQPADDGELPIEAAAADTEATRDLGTPAAGIDDPIARDLIACEAESPLAMLGKRHETTRLAQHRASLHGALAQLRSKGAAIEQPSLAERMEDEVLMAEYLRPPRGAHADAIDMPIERQQPEPLEERARFRRHLLADAVASVTEQQHRGAESAELDGRGAAGGARSDDGDAHHAGKPLSVSTFMEAGNASSPGPGRSSTRPRRYQLSTILASVCSVVG
jgi:hypothetical protein